MTEPTEKMIRAGVDAFLDWTGGFGDDENAVVVRKILEAALSVPDGWQSIETAPKEMEPLLLWQEQWLNPVMGRWSDARNGWIEYGSRDIKANIATHWRPLPAPPAGGGESE